MGKIADLRVVADADKTPKQRRAKYRVKVLCRGSGGAYMASSARTAETFVRDVLLGKFGKFRAIIIEPQ